MNIIGRVVGGVLILLSFAWLASLAGIRPFLGTNQVQSNKATPVSTNNTTPNRTGVTSAVAPANKQAQVTSTAVEANPRDAQQSQPGQKQQSANTGTSTGTNATPANSAGTSATGTPNQPTTTTPVSAGW
ncbi:hypothetical protein [Alkalinema pantanalense]|uniref:hypothetical protein n=1 Tax=Alkalinema pantanalense TaxID=1620705 RepID=UPI003D6ED98C